MTYNKSNQVYKNSDGPVLCACMGPVYGEPLCPCSMRQAGLPLSKEHVVASEKDKVELAAFFKTWQERP